MKTPGPGLDAADDPPPKVTRGIADEAAAWVARLHGPERSRQMELDCLKWQSLSDAHRHAFERCTQVWMEIPNAARAAGYVPTARRPSGERRVGGGRRRMLGATLASCGLVAVALAVWVPWRGGTDYQTAVGEARTVVLEDGSRMSLNTDTSVQVEMGAAQRTVVLARGEAMFQVARDAVRPFVVRAAASEVVALGTAFAVRFNPARGDAGQMLTVTLMEGQVAVRSAAGRAADDVAPAQALVMQPGQRVRLAQTPGATTPARQEVDWPRLDQVTAWQRNEAVFDRTSLADAVAEMNRYSRTPLVLVGGLADERLLVSGQFRTGDNTGFAKALAALHGLAVRARDGRLELSRES